MERIPESVLSERVFTFLEAKELANVALVCKAWREAAELDEPWQANCKATWEGKQAMPFSYTGAPEHPFWKIRLTKDAINALSVKDLKLLLHLRKVDTGKFIEKQEYRKEFIATTPGQVSGWSALYNSKWKASYIYALFDAKRQEITKDELTTYSWQLFFKASSFVCDFKFFPDGTVQRIMGSNQDSRWIMRSSAMMIQVGEYPPLHVSRRSSDWGWKLENDHVILYSENYKTDLRKLFQQDLQSHFQSRR